MSVEFSRPISTERVGPNGLDISIEADATECAALAQRMQLPAVLAVTCDFHLRRVSAEALEAEGHLRAHVVQTCVVTLDDFPAEMVEDFRVRFVPAGQESDDPNPETIDEIGYAGGMIDLGEAAAEQLGLALDPYPRQPGVELPDIDGDAAGEESPFAVLRRRTH